MGHSIFEFTHPCDHEEIRNNLRLTAGVFVWLCVYTVYPVVALLRDHAGLNRFHVAVHVAY